MKLFITGATGFLGKELIPILSQECEEIHLLVRGESLAKAKKSFADYCNIYFHRGDLTNPDLLEGEYDELLEKIDSILHMGAYYDLEGSHEECFTQNVLGTLNLLFFARLCRNLKSLNYISTVAVSGESKGKFFEEDFYHKESFSNEYSKTKWEAERLVREWQGDAKVRIYRPGIIIGHSKTGYFEKIDGPYYFWKTLSNITTLAPIIAKLPFLPMPIDSKASLPVISVDNAAQLIKNGLFLECKKKILTFHLVEESAPSILELIEKSLKAFSIDTKILVTRNHYLMEKTFKLLGLPKEIIHYMVTPVEYSVSNTSRLLDLDRLAKFDSYKDIIISEAKKSFEVKK